MSPQDTIDLSREAITMAAIIGGPILAAGLLIGLVLGVLQAMTQIQDQTVSAVPKIIGMALVALLALPWMSERMVDFTRESFSRPLVGGVKASGPPIDPASSAATFATPREGSIRVAAAPRLPVAPRLLSVSASPQVSASSGVNRYQGPGPSMPALRFQGSSMPQMTLPATPAGKSGGTPFRLPTFHRSNPQHAPLNIGG